MKLGFLTACLPGLNLSELTKWASEQGFQTLELAAWPVDSNRDYQAKQIDPASLSEDYAKCLKDIFSNFNIEVSSLAYYDNNLHPEKEKRQTYLEHLIKVIKAARMLDVNLVGTFVGGRPDKSPAENIKEIGNIFREIVKCADDNGVKIMIENCPMDGWMKFGQPGNYAYSPELWEALFNEVPYDNFGLNFDPSHLFWQQIDISRAIRDFSTKIFHTHAKDTEILKDGVYKYGIFGKQINPVPWKSGWWRYRIPGLGQINWAEFVRSLKLTGFDGVISIEHEDPDWEGSEDNIKKGLKLGLKHLKPLLEQ